MHARTKIQRCADTFEQDFVIQEIWCVPAGVPMSAAAKDVAKQLGVGRKELYDVAMKVRISELGHALRKCDQH